MLEKHKKVRLNDADVNVALKRFWALPVTVSKKISSSACFKMAAHVFSFGFERNKILHEYIFKQKFKYFGTSSGLAFFWLMDSRKHAFKIF